MLEELRGYLTDQYFSRGKYGVSIDTKVEDQPDNRVRIKIDIKEGERARIRQINIVGNTKFKEKDILETFELKTPKWNTWYKASTTAIPANRCRATWRSCKSYYQDRGYANFDIESAQVTIAPEKDDMFITVSVKEGDDLQDLRRQASPATPSCRCRTCRRCCWCRRARSTPSS